MDDALIKYYEDLAVRKSDDFDSIVRALELAEKFILHNKKILVGGQAIDYALKSKGEKGIYDETALKDLDIITDTHFQDAYAFATILVRHGFTGISVINAMHPSTMKVRVNFKEIIDITYIPTNILKNIPTIWHKGFQIVHPHFQYIDQHRSLTYPYENAPRETILQRPRKDMTRYDLLYAHYPLRLLFIKNTTLELTERKIPLDILSNQCISGFFALNYWIHEAKKLGFQTNINLGESNLDSFSKESQDVTFHIPVDSYGLTIFSDDIHGFNKILETYKDNKEYNLDGDKKFYARFLDKFPRKFVSTSLNTSINTSIIEVFDNSHQIAAHKLVISNNNTVHIANLQSIMMYLLTNYILLMKIENVRRSYSFYMGYLVCRDIIEWASAEYYLNNTTKTSDRKSNIARFLPTAEIYGKENLSDAYIVSKFNFDKKNKTIDSDQKNMYDQPKHVYDRDLIYKKVPKKYYDFDVSTSEIFNFDGTAIPDFLNH